MPQLLDLWRSFQSTLGTAAGAVAIRRLTMFRAVGSGGMSEHDECLGVQPGTTRRQALRRFWVTGVLATAGAGLSELLLVPRASATVSSLGPAVPSATILAALPADAPVGLRDAIASGCCLYYTRDEGACSPACGTGSCCYVISGCYNAGPTCIGVPCSRGNFTSGSC